MAGHPANADEWTQEILCGNFRGTTWNKVPLPTVPAEEITAWYQHPTRHVSYNNDQYETESIYERKYLSGSDQYAVFLNSNQAQTVIEGSGKNGKLLLIKDSYGNTFAQFPVEDYAEVHVIDLRFFKGRCGGVRQRKRHHRRAGALRRAELCEGYKSALLTETARSLRGAGQKADGQRAVGFCPFCRLCAGEAGDLLRKTERRKKFCGKGA